MADQGSELLPERFSEGAVLKTASLTGEEQLPEVPEPTLVAQLLRLQGQPTLKDPMLGRPAIKVRDTFRPDQWHPRSIEVALSQQIGTQYFLLVTGKAGLINDRRPDQLKTEDPTHLRRNIRTPVALSLLTLRALSVNHATNATWKFIYSIHADHLPQQ